jgi:hypothetical protein
MKTTNMLALIDIEAEERQRSVVPVSEVVRLAETLGVAPREAPAALGAERRAELVEIVGTRTADSMTEGELALIERAVAKLPPPAPEDSFVWSAVAGPAAVDPLVRAVMVYHRFNAQAVGVSERIGANDEFRRFIRQCSFPPETQVTEVLEVEQRYVDRISSFVESLNSFVSAAEAVFGPQEWTIASLLVITAAASGFRHSQGTLGKGWSLSSVPSQQCLDEVEALRMEMAYAAREVKESHGLNLLRYSLSSLAGIRRSLFDGGADFHSALDAFGIVEDDEERLVTLAGHVRAFLSTCDRLEATLSEGGYSEGDMSRVMSFVLIRRYLVSACEASGLLWADVSPLLTPLPVVSAEDFAALVSALEHDKFSAKLESVSRDKSQRIANVQLASDQYVFARQYWIDAGRRVTAFDPGIRLMDLKAILEMEPEIHANTETLAKAGAIDRADVDALEHHLEWLIGVYGLPVSNDVIKTILATKGRAVGAISASYS